ncbi:MAG TPA: TonB family protein [Longimicrobiales bacterium]|nr:TonB family protein [Longimicrobiales bacterium]
MSTHPVPTAGEPVFTHLFASRPPRSKGAAAGATATSLIFHALTVGALIWASIAASQRPQEVPDQVLMAIKLEPEAPTPPPPPPPPPDVKSAPPVAVQDVAKGFQVLSTPTFVPPDIPPPKTGAMINEADFSGEGVEGGKANGNPNSTRVVTVEDIVAAPTFTPYTVAPELKNGAEVVAALKRFYPQFLRDSGVGGTVLIWLLIDEHGKVIKTVVKEPSRYVAFDEAALKVGELMRFSPGYNRDIAVMVWVALPIHFVTQ